MVRKAVALWCAKSKSDTPYRVNVYPVLQQRPHGLTPVAIYRSPDSAINYSPRHLHTWDELTVGQKEAVFREYYRAAESDARWRIAKDPELRDQFKTWREQARKERDEAIAALKAGKPVDPPNLFV